MVWESFTSDISAGLALGKSVAALFIARARTDGMGTAGGNKAIWEALKLMHPAGDEPWVSLETPPRPPMLPLFNKVLPWKMTYDEIVAIRPPAPPLRGSAEMDAECAEVKYYSDNLTT